MQLTRVPFYHLLLDFKTKKNISKGLLVALTLYIVNVHFQPELSIQYSPNNLNKYPIRRKSHLFSIVEFIHISTRRKYNKESKFEKNVYFSWKEIWSTDNGHRWFTNLLRDPGWWLGLLSSSFAWTARVWGYSCPFWSCPGPPPSPAGSHVCGQRSEGRPRSLL